MPLRTSIVTILILSLLGVTRMGHADKSDEQTSAIAAVLDAFHLAASKADAKAYFALLTNDAVFLGTDATERWPKRDFEAFAKPYFDNGKGWTYGSTQREIVIDPGGSHAMFDELLKNDAYGTCRGSGVLRRVNGKWRIAQYNLSIPMPNALAGEFVARIRAEATGRAGTRTVFVVRHFDTQGKARDRSLTETGKARAGRLKGMLEDAGVTRCIASTYARTRETLASLAELRALEVERSELSMVALANAIRTGREGAVIVAGHSNTVPELLGALGVKDAPEISEDRFGDLFVVTIPAGGTPHMVRMRVP